MRRFVKWTWRILAGLFTIVVLALVGAYIAARSSLPDYDGRVRVPGLEGKVTVIRDSNAVPQIHADNDADAYFALGYVHAQDRLFQMEMTRRIGQGRLSEVRFLGESGLRIDRFMRTLGIYRLAQADYRRASPHIREMLDAYAAGVNAFLDTRDGLLPPEFLLLGIEPEPWRPADSLVWGRLMAMQLSTNWRSELLRLRIRELVGERRMRSLWPGYPTQGPSTIESWRKAGYEPAPMKNWQHLWAALPHALISNGSSNVWAVHGRHTATGKPVLANDPHLGMGAPILWYFARIKTPTLDLTGVTVPGVPLHILGHNGSVAWGYTTTYIDTDDLFLERIDPDNPDRYLTPDGPRSFDIRRETIRMSGGEAVEIEVRSTRHGPVISDIVPESLMPRVPPGHVLALSAPWLREGIRTAQALYDMGRAESVESFTESLKNFDAPLQNVVYADTAGNIAHYVPGLIPIRRNGDGFMPSPGWTGEYDWTGFIPFEERPHTFTPADGILVNANNRIVERDYPYFLSREWGDRFRAARITDLLNNGSRPHSLDDSAGMQADSVSPMARELLRQMMAVAQEDEIAQRAATMLRAWDGLMDRRRPEPLIFVAWLTQLNEQLYGDELGEMKGAFLGLRPDVVLSILTEHPEWCDNVGTDGKTETCPEQLRSSLNAAVVSLRERFGERMDDWRWGAAHKLAAKHRVFDFIPGLRDLANITIETDGGSYTINRGAMDVGNKRDRFAHRHGSGFRGIYDLADLSRSRFIIATGQSGHPLSRYYDNLVERWRNVEYFQAPPTREAAAAEAVGTLILEPAERR